ncbi:hypothetical protein K435DRAFT_880189 [Dendrothele bispora CBS 962.96]|uniref:Uncharacterized protein n=1 Tax=Dendrothele bispora (strain CBS 962.96) TaxID=1314807 RepID=A0A4S8KJZ4_DENBC|nr:hypothetical protein K435DRAFT_880189 [Dendrothele bispora CBS 962.96]
MTGLQPAITIPNRRNTRRTKARVLQDDQNQSRSPRPFPHTSEHEEQIGQESTAPLRPPSPPLSQREDTGTTRCPPLPSTSQHHALGRDVSDTSNSSAAPSKHGLHNRALPDRSKAHLPPTRSNASSSPGRSSSLSSVQSSPEPAQAQIPPGQVRGRADFNWVTPPPPRGCSLPPASPSLPLRQDRNATPGPSQNDFQWEPSVEATPPRRTDKGKGREVPAIPIRPVAPAVSPSRTLEQPPSSPAPARPSKRSRHRQPTGSPLVSMDQSPRSPAPARPSKRTRRKHHTAHVGDKRPLQLSPEAPVSQPPVRTCHPSKKLKTSRKKHIHTQVYSSDSSSSSSSSSSSHSPPQKGDVVKRKKRRTRSSRRKPMDSDSSSSSRSSSPSSQSTDSRSASDSDDQRTIVPFRASSYTPHELVARTLSKGWKETMPLTLFCSRLMKNFSPVLQKSTNSVTGPPLVSLNEGDLVEIAKGYQIAISGFFKYKKNSRVGGATSTRIGQMFHDLFAAVVARKDYHEKFPTWIHYLQTTIRSWETSPGRLGLDISSIDKSSFRRYHDHITDRKKEFVGKLPPGSMSYLTHEASSSRSSSFPFPESSRSSSRAQRPPTSSNSRNQANPSSDSLACWLCGSRSHHHRFHQPSNSDFLSKRGRVYLDSQNRAYCIAFNGNGCSTPNCKYEHLCGRCGSGDHNSQAHASGRSAGNH